MAKFRRGHQSQRGSSVRTGTLLMAAMIVVLAVVFVRKVSLPDSPSATIAFSHSDKHQFLPDDAGGEVIHHAHFSLSYAEQFEQAYWVAYELTIDELNAPRVPRYDRFNADYSVSTRSAFYRDYTNSGYTRGHLAPASDMAFDTLAMRESFYMSNVSPQVRPFNNGVWRELEEQTRDWARRFGRLYIVTGPVLTQPLIDRIGQNRVGVPSAFYKVLYDPDLPEVKGIAFIIPNALSDRPLMEYAVPIDSVESLTGINFFSAIQDSVFESTFDPQLWPVDTRRFRKRVEQWNLE